MKGAMCIMRVFDGADAIDLDIDAEVAYLEFTLFDDTFPAEHGSDFDFVRTEDRSKLGNSLN